MKSTLPAASLLTFSILAAQALEFEVASVKPADKQDRSALPSLPGLAADTMAFEGGPGSKDPGRINYHGVSLKALLARAYNVKTGQVSGPGWLGSERYTIEAILPPGTKPDQLRLMLQKLLTERFQISLHKDVKETPVYRLIVAKNGPKLKPPEDVPQYQDEGERRDYMQKQAQANLERMLADRGQYSRAFGLARATMERFADALATNLDRPVKDMTQIEGEHSFHLEWTPDGSMRADSSGVSIFIAIQEQLGLKLEAANENIEFVVIDKAEKIPASN